jgi:type III restriction enzyme
MSAVDEDRIEAIAASLDLRLPNREALEAIAWRTHYHFDTEAKPPPFECVIDSATGAGKTYVLAAAIEYFAGDGVRNFAVVTPGRTILGKTVDNFTAGNERSLLGGMSVEPVVITSENFASAAIRAAMDDPDQAKLFVFTVQALTKPSTKLGKKTHEFQEGLGAAFYTRLQESEDLVVFADEHHTYYGPAFSDAVRDLNPHVLVGLTATPHPRTPPEQIIYRYPLAQAIADRNVKTPVIVGRKDDLTDPTTKLLDGIALLEVKEQAIARYCQLTGKAAVVPVMLVIAQKIDEANELEELISQPSFAGGRYKDRVLTVTSDSPDAALEALANLERLDSPYRIVISVGMLKEGWDVRNVYVLASMRASVSTILTEQTLGRGLRLPFGEYTGIEILDTLEVLGHERYEQLLAKAGVLNEQFVDYRTYTAIQTNARGERVPVIETTTVSAPITVSDDGSTEVLALGAGAPVIASIEEHTARATEELFQLQQELYPREGFEPLRVPVLKMTTISVPFSLADITDHKPFRELGERLKADPVSELRRVRLSARTVTGADGLRHTEMVTAPAVDKVVSQGALLPLDDAVGELRASVMDSAPVPARPQEAKALTPLLDAFLDGLGGQADAVLSGYMDRVAAGFIDLITKEQRRYGSKPTYDEVIDVVTLQAARIARGSTTQDRLGKYQRGVGYQYAKSIYAQDWFDSSTERDTANILEDAADIAYWVRLQTGDLPILWHGSGREYNPDFIGVDKDGVHWIIEVKMNKEMPSAEVQGKREAAMRWAQHVNADPKVSDTWRYLLVSEDHVKTAKGSWTALRQLGE